ncbi:DUF6268 family outer membrane beta-barrel protein [Maribacter ulvicola]|nr:DUF6268 family outer membrane beta-barrel protein [Maribacter ulvicola]
MRVRLFLFFFITYSIASHAQLSDLARLDFTYIPNKGSDVEYTRSRFLFNYPLKLNKEGQYLFLGVDYSNVHLRFKDDMLPFDRELLNDFKLLDFTIGFTKPLKKGWRLGVRFQPGISTNNAAKTLNANDLVFSGDVVFIKKFENYTDKPSRLILGLSYSQNRGYVFPLPFISYYEKFRPDWSFNIGIPKTNLQYHLSDRHRFKLYAQLDGFTSNIQNGALVNGNEYAELINMSLVNGGLQYEFHFTDHLQLDLRAAYNFNLNNKLKDGRNNTLLTIDNDSRSYFRAVLRFKI